MKIRVLEATFTAGLRVPGTREIASAMNVDRHPTFTAYVDEHGLRIPGDGNEFRLIPWSTVKECSRCVVEAELPTGGGKRAA